MPRSQALGEVEWAGLESLLPSSDGVRGRPFDRILVTGGRRPRPSGLGRARAGVAGTDTDAIHVDAART